MKIKINCKTCGRPFTCDIDDNYKSHKIGSILSIIECFKCRRLTKIVWKGNGQIETSSTTRLILRKWFMDCEKENREAKCIS